jgi:hypothetical protein
VCDDVVDTWHAAFASPTTTPRAECESVLDAGVPAPSSPEAKRWIAVDCARTVGPSSASMSTSDLSTRYWTCTSDAQEQLQEFFKAADDLANIRAYLAKNDLDASVLDPCEDLHTHTHEGFYAIASFVPADAVKPLIDASQGALCQRDVWIHKAQLQETAAGRCANPKSPCSTGEGDEDCEEAYVALARIPTSYDADPAVTSARADFARACPAQAVLPPRPPPTDTKDVPLPAEPAHVPPGQDISSLNGTVTLTVPDTFDYCHQVKTAGIKCVHGNLDPEIDVVFVGADAGGTNDLAKLMADYERGMVEGEPSYKRTGAPKPATCAGVYDGLEVRGGFTDALGGSFRTRLCTFVRTGHAFWVFYSMSASSDSEGEKDAQALIAGAHYH